MKFGLKYFFASASVFTLAAGFWACSDTISATTEDDENECGTFLGGAGCLTEADIVGDTNNDATSSSVDPVSSSSLKLVSSSSEAVSSSSVEPVSSSSEEPESSSSEAVSSSSEVPVSSTEELLSSSSEAVSSSSETVESSSSEESDVNVIDQSNLDKAMESVTEEESKTLDELKDLLERGEASSGEFIKADTLVLSNKDMDFDQNDYYCFDGEGNWRKITKGSLQATFAGLWDLIVYWFTGKHYYDFRKACDAIYIKKRA